MNLRLVEPPLLHFSAYLVVNRVQIWTIRSHTSGEMKLGIFHFRIHEGNCWAAK